MSKNAPDAPDPIATANAQGAANKEAVAESAKVNAVNQYTPYGSVIYNKDATGLPTSVTSSLTPLQQQALDQKNQLAVTLGGQAINQAGNLPTDKYSLDQFGPAPSSTDYAAQGDQVRQAYYDKQMGMLDPTFTQENARLEQSIANRGLPINGEGAKTLEDNLYRRQADAKDQVSNNAVLAGGNEQSRLFGLDMTARNQGISEYNQQRQQPFNELSAYLTGQPVFQAPTAQQQTYQVAPADVSGNIYQNYNAANQKYMANLNGMYSLAGSAAGAGATFAASDRRLKRNIKAVGKMRDSGLTVYRYRYNDRKQWHVGLMADEVKTVIPGAVIRHATGFDMVDYARVF